MAVGAEVLIKYARPYRDFRATLEIEKQAVMNTQSKRDLSSCKPDRRSRRESFTPVPRPVFVNHSVPPTFLHEIRRTFEESLD